MATSRACRKFQMRARPLFVDRHVVVISKPSGVVSQIGSNKNTCDHDDAAPLELILDDLVTKLGFHMRPTPVHRLDKVTWWNFSARSGAFLFARTPHAARELSQQFSSRTVHKTYLALVRAGKETFKTASGQIEGKIRYLNGRPSIDKNGTSALTSWSLIDSSAITPVSLLKLTLHTGLKHQLRVHLSHILKGDTLHSISKPSAKITGVADIPDGRLFLHASQISFARYRKAAPKKYSVDVFAPVPKDFLAICRKLGLKLDSRDVHGGVLVNGENAPWNLMDFESWWMSRSSASSVSITSIQEEENVQ